MNRIVRTHPCMRGPRHPLQCRPGRAGMAPDAGLTIEGHQVVLADGVEGDVAEDNETAFGRGLWIAIPLVNTLENAPSETPAATQNVHFRLNRLYKMGRIAPAGTAIS